MLLVHVNITFVSQLHVHVDTACPCQCCISDAFPLPRSAMDELLLSDPPHPQLYHALQQVHAVWRKNGCYHPDVIVTIHPDDNNSVIIQPDESIKCYRPAR
jgi:hypothetical protein